MVGALLSFSTMAVSIRELTHVLSIVETLALRSALGLPHSSSSIGCTARPRPPALAQPQAHRAAPCMRNGVHFASQIAWATGLTLLPLATVFALEFTMPAWTALLATMFLHERMTPSRIGAVILGFVGVLVIIRPGLESFQPAAFLVLAAAFGYAITLTATKRLTATDTTYGIVFWMNLMQLPMNFAGSDPTFVLAKARLGAARADHRPRRRGPDVALLHVKRVPGRRGHPGGAARFHADPVDRPGGLVAVRRTARHLRFCGRRLDHLRSTVEPARRDPAAGFARRCRTFARRRLSR